MRLVNTLKERPSEGFTLTEVMVAASIILVTITSFGLFLSKWQNTQVSNRMDLLATRILQNEEEYLASIPWDDLMTANSLEGGTCDLGDGRVSGKLIKPGPERIVADRSIAPAGIPSGMTVSVTREVTWNTILSSDPSTGQIVDCQTNSKDRDDIKRVTITAEWVTPSNIVDKSDSEKVNSKTIVVYRSRWSEVPGFTDEGATR